jgi:F420-non-reducing hydrogenase iron-sulfur subunit
MNDRLNGDSSIFVDTKIGTAPEQTSFERQIKGDSPIFVVDHRSAMVPEIGTVPEQTSFEPKIVAYVCNWCTYLGADLAGTNRLEYPSNVRIIRLPCTGRIDFNLIVKAFEIGADAVLVSGCHPGDCHYTAGNYHARRRWILFRQLLDTLGIDLRRVHFSWISAAEGKKWQSIITEITENTRKLGPYTAYREICTDDK